MVRSAAIRGSGSRSTSASSIMATRPVVPATYVPEELVAQAQVVLQGKTRNLIIRELQVDKETTTQHYRDDISDFLIISIYCVLENQFGR